MAKDAKKPKKAKQPKAPKVAENAISVAAHPRAVDGIRRAKGIGGMIGLLLVGMLSLQAGAPIADAALRGLVGGVVGYVTFWTLAVHTWRHLVVAEARAAAHKAREILEAAEDGASEQAT
jgi:predicted lipid-binding transport protein (Tim44 family)